MANWTDIPDAVLEIGQPIRSIDAKALRDNPRAIAEGASGAPRIAAAALQTGNPERDWVLDRNAEASVGSVGTYAHLRRVDVITIMEPGTVVAGSSLRFSNNNSSQGNTPTGMWQLMGQANVAIGAEMTSVWLRIS